MRRATGACRRFHALRPMRHMVMNNVRHSFVLLKFQTVTFVMVSICSASCCFPSWSVHSGVSPACLGAPVGPAAGGCSVSRWPFCHPSKWERCRERTELPVTPFRSAASVMPYSRSLGSQQNSVWQASRR